MTEKKRWARLKTETVTETSESPTGPTIITGVEVIEEEDDGDADLVESKESLTPEEAIERDRMESKKERDAAVSSLSLWVDVEKPTNEPILRRLLSDLKAGRRLNEWGAFPLDDLLRPPSQAQQNWATDVANLLTIVRNLFLFLPVLLTWIAIDVAAEAYDKSDGARTFLSVWSSQELDLQQVAQWDAVLIASLIALTLFAHVIEAIGMRIADRAEDVADNRFRDVMVNVGLYLHGFRQITPAALGGGLADSVNQLVIATNAMKDASENMERITAMGSLTLEKFARLSVEEFAPASERLKDLASTLESAAGTHENLAELVKALQGHLSGTIGSMESEIRELVRELVAQMEMNINSVAVMSVDVGSKMDAIGNNLQAAASTTLAAVEGLYRPRGEGRGDGIPRS